MQIWDKLVAIGYSFRDEPVNTAILENLKRTKTSILIVIDPDAEEVIKKFERFKLQNWTNALFQFAAGLEKRTRFNDLK